MASYKTNKYLFRNKFDVYRWFVNLILTFLFSNKKNIYFLGTVRVDDNLKYPIPHFGYPPMKRPQHKFSGSSNDLSFTSSNPATKSLDTFTWSATDALNQRPSLSQYSNRFQSHAKDNFSYWPTDLQSKKTRCEYYKKTRS